MFGFHGTLPKKVMEEEQDNTKYFAIGFAVILLVGVGILVVQFLGLI